MSVNLTLRWHIRESVARIWNDRTKEKLMIKEQVLLREVKLEVVEKHDGRHPESFWFIKELNSTLTDQFTTQLYTLRLVMKKELFSQFIFINNTRDEDLNWKTQDKLLLTFSNNLTDTNKIRVWINVHSRTNLLIFTVNARCIIFDLFY